MTDIEQRPDKGKRFVLAAGIITIGALTFWVHGQSNSIDCQKVYFKVNQDSFGQADISAYPQTNNHDPIQAASGFITNGDNLGEIGQTSADNPDKVNFQLYWNQSTLLLQTSTVQLDVVIHNRMYSCPQTTLYLNPHSFSITPRNTAN